MSFEPFSVQMGLKLRRRMLFIYKRQRNGKKEKNAGEESHKTVIFHHHVEAPFRNRSTPNFVSV